MPAKVTVLHKYVTDGDVGCGSPGSPQWHRTMILQLENQELADYVLDIGFDKTVEAMDGDST